MTHTLTHLGLARVEAHLPRGLAVPVRGQVVDHTRQPVQLEVPQLGVRQEELPAVGVEQRRAHLLGARLPVQRACVCDVLAPTHLGDHALLGRVRVEDGRPLARGDQVVRVRLGPEAPAPLEAWPPLALAREDQGRTAVPRAALVRSAPDRERAWQEEPRPVRVPRRALHAGALAAAQRTLPHVCGHPLEQLEKGALLGEEDVGPRRTQPVHPPPRTPRVVVTLGLGIVARVDVHVGLETAPVRSALAAALPLRLAHRHGVPRRGLLRGGLRERRAGGWQRARHIRRRRRHREQSAKLKRSEPAALDP